jgi:hypothetical protein
MDNITLSGVPSGCMASPVEDGRTYLRYLPTVSSVCYVSATIPCGEALSNALPDGGLTRRPDTRHPPHIFSR